MPGLSLFVSCLLASLVGGLAGGDETPVSKARIATQVLAITDIVLEQHLEPPTRQQMILSGARRLFEAAATEPPVDLGKQISMLATPAELTAFIERIWSEATTSSETPDADLVFALTEGMLWDVAGPAQLLSKKEANVQNQLANNRYVGIGIALGNKDGWPVMHQVFPGGPAQKGGAKDGDIIVTIDGVGTEGQNLQQIVERLRGPEGSTLKVALRSGDAETPRILDLVRGVVPFQHVGDFRKVLLNEGPGSIAYVNVQQLSSSVLHELRNFEAQWRSGRVRAVVLDLRHTRGDDVHNAVTLADGLLDGGKIGNVWSTHGTKEYSARPDCLFRDWPMVVLVGPGTSGTAEWLAAALQDNQRAVLIGMPTAGNQWIETVHPVPDSDMAVRLTTGKLLRGNGTPISSVPLRANPRTMTSLGSFAQPHPRMPRQPSEKESRGGIVPDHEMETESPRNQRPTPVAGPQTGDVVKERLLEKAAEVIEGMLKREVDPGNSLSPQSE